jgi:uncharacterized protein
VTRAADELIAQYALEPHPEGGWYRRMWTHPERDEAGRAKASAIHYLLKAGDQSAWHRIDADELWVWHAGGPLALRTVDDGHPAVVALGGGPGLARQHLVPAGVWQSAVLTPAAVDHVLVSCVVVPEFTFAGWEALPGSSRPS